MARRIKIKRSSKIKGVMVKISPALKKDLTKIVQEYKSLGIEISYAEASEFYRRNR